MDGDRFDTFSRVLASGINRRGVLRVVAGGLAGAALSLLGGVDEAGASCRRNGRSCRKHAHCCSDFCTSHRRRRSVCATCESGITCGDICCPPGAVNGCTTFNGPNGLVAVCLCPEGTLYDRAANSCVPCGGADKACRINDHCCSDNCCGGACCPLDSPYCCKDMCSSQPCCDVVGCEDKDKACCGGVCVPPDECRCPPGTACSGAATCISFGQTVSVDCCPYPQFSFCCGDSAPGTHDGISGCCDGQDCPDACPNGGYKAEGGRAGTCCGIDSGLCSDVKDCCLEGANEGGSVTIEQSCIVSGQPCNPNWPCCNGRCAGTTCS